MATNFDHYNINEKASKVFILPMLGGSTREINVCSSILGDYLGNKNGGLIGD